MSVIQDALRRKMQEERDRDGTQAAPRETSEPQTYVPPTMGSSRRRTPPSRSAMAPSSSYPSERPVQREQASFPAWMLIVFMAVGAAVFALIYYRGQTMPRVATPAPTSIPVVLPEPVAVATIVSESPAPAPAPSPDRQPALVGKADRETADGEPPVSDGPTAAKQSSVTRDDWPRIELMGILAGGEDKRSTAILNGALVMLDAQIDEVTLAEVGEDGVYLEFKGDRQYIRIGEHTR